jgi:hypothetical protein
LLYGTYSKFYFEVTTKENLLPLELMHNTDNSFNPENIVFLIVINPLTFPCTTSKERKEKWFSSELLQK